MIYGYCRISTKKQNIERQVRNIEEVYPDAHIIRETFTGTKVEGRKEFNNLMKNITSGDTIVFDSVSRMSRNAEEGVELYMKLYDKGVELIFLKEAHINTATYKKSLQNAVPMTGTDVDFILEGINKYLKALAAEQVKLSFGQAEKEVKDLSARTSEGLKTAKLNGKQVGGKAGVTLTTKKSVKAKEIILKNSKDFNGSNTDTEVIKIAGISRNSYYKYKRELIESLRADE